jgi:hypothetical protein
MTVRRSNFLKFLAFLKSEKLKAHVGNYFLGFVSRRNITDSFVCGIAL